MNWRFWSRRAANSAKSKTGRLGSAPLAPPFAEGAGDWYFRRAIGFTLKVHWPAKTSSIRCLVKRHGGEREVQILRAHLREWMSLDAFSLWPLERERLRWFEENDLVYYSQHQETRTTTGTPTARGPLSDVGLSLRDGVNVTLALSDGDSISPWLFMPRRGVLAERTLVGVRFGSFERDSEVYAVDVQGDAHTGQCLRELVSALDGQRTWAQIVDSFEPQHRNEVSALLSLLDDCALLQARSLTPTLAPIPLPEHYVMWLGHACVVVKVGTKAILVDPLFMRRSVPPAPNAPEAFNPQRLPPIDAIAITHGDNDHLNPPSLFRLPSDIPVIVPRAVEARPYQVDISEVLSFLNFETQLPLGPWESHRLADVTITALPFEGEDWGLSLAKATYLIEGPAGRVFLSADSAPMPDVWAKIAASGAVDVAFLGVSGCQEPLVCPPGFGYGEFYALWLPRARRNEWQKLCAGPQDAVAAALAINARQVVGYAAGGGSFTQMSHSDDGSREALFALLQASGEGSRVCNLAVGQVKALGTGQSL